LTSRDVAYGPVMFVASMRGAESDASIWRLCSMPKEHIQLETVKEVAAPDLHNIVAKYCYNKHNVDGCSTCGCRVANQTIGQLLALPSQGIHGLNIHLVVQRGHWPEVGRQSRVGLLQCSAKVEVQKHVSLMLIVTGLHLLVTVLSNVL